MLPIRHNSKVSVKFSLVIPVFLVQNKQSVADLFCSVLFCSRPQSEGWPHCGRTFSIYRCPLSFWLTLPRRVLCTFWCCLPQGVCGPALCSECNSVPTQRTLPWTARPLYFPSSTENSFLWTLPMDTETQSHSCFVMRPLSPNNKLPLKLPGHGTRWLLNWFKRLADGSHLSPRPAERQYFCSSACPLPFNGEMRSPSSARSLPPINHPLQSFLA